MEAFFSALNGLEIVLFILASAASILLVIQVILLLIGMGGHDFDFHGFDTSDVDHDPSAGADFSIITLKGIIAFFSIGGWVGFGVSQAGIHPALAILAGIISGGLAMVGIGYLYKLGYKLQSDGTVNLANAVGQVAKVYLTVPAKGNGSGKVNITIQERFVEAEAITESADPIATNEMVRVVGCYEENILIVEKLA